MNIFLGWISDANNITFAIAVISFLLSVYNFVEARIINRKKLDVSIDKMLLEKTDFIFILGLTNRSKLPITITAGHILLPNQTECSFGEVSEAIFYYNNPTLSGKATETTQRFPVKLESYEAVKILVKFTTWNVEWNKYVPCSCQMILGSSRGIIKKQIKLPASYSGIKDILKRAK